MDKNAQVKALVPETGMCERISAQIELLAEKHPATSKRPALFGKLLGVKDVFFTDILPTRAGSWLPADAFTGTKSIAVSQLLNAGAVLAGKTHCNEFSYYQAAPTLNPLFPELSPGGSSSGSAAAVAAGICDLALGSQSRAGIMLPAAYCGVLGFKPGAGRVSKQGMFPFSQSLDQVGLFSKNWKIMQQAAKILLLKQEQPVETEKRVVLGIPHSSFLLQADEDVLSHFYALLDKLRTAGFVIRETSCFQDYQTINHLHYDLFAAEFTQNHIPLYHEYQALYSPSARELFDRGMKISPDKLYEARDMQQVHREKAHEVMLEDGITILLSPAMASLPPKASEEPAKRMMSLPFSFCGLPSMCLPLFNHPTGLPYGFQLSTFAGQDELLLSSRIQTIHDVLKTNI